MTATTFRLSDLDDHTLGWALLCPRVQYASIWWTDSPRPDRRQASVTTWLAIDAEIAEGLPAAGLARGSVITRLFATEDQALIVRYVSAAPIAIKRPELAVSVLDARLQQLVLESTPVRV